MSKGLTSPHFIKGPVSKPLASAAHLQHLTMCTGRSVLLQTGTPLLDFGLFPPCLSCVCSFAAPQNWHCKLRALQNLNHLWHRRITCWQTGQRTPWKTEQSWHLWTRHSDLWTRAGFKLETAAFYRNNWLYPFAADPRSCSILQIAINLVWRK